MIQSLANSIAGEVFAPEGTTHSAMGMSHSQMVAHAYGYHLEARKWVELTEEEVIRLLTEHHMEAAPHRMALVRAIAQKLKEKNQ